MKKVILNLIVPVLLIATGASGQNKQSVAPLKVGDKMPNLVLDQIGEVVYNKTGAKKFSDFKGKLVILDFWDINCGSCIAGFPKMEKLQQEFKDSIQVIFVNSAQNKKEIVSDLGKQMLGDRFPYEVPQIYNAKILGELFPYEFSGNQVWIGPDGTLPIVSGHPFNNHEVKIRELLAGEKIKFVKSPKRKDANPGALYKKTSYFVPAVQSGIYPFSDEYGACESQFKNVIDSANKTIRSTYVNYQLLNLYREVLYDDIVKSWSKEIFSPYAIPYLNKIALDVKDTLRYTPNYIGGSKRDIDWIKCIHCYEQITPTSLSSQLRKQYMLEDLNRYFGNLYGTTAKVETVNKTCFLLVVNSISQLAKLKNNSNSNSSAPYQRFEEGGKKMLSWNNEKLSSVIQSYAQIIFRETKEKPFFDETNFSDRVNLILPDPSELKTIDELKAALHPFGLDIITGDRKVDMIVIRDNK